jgi:hypothetical protein
MFIYYEKHFSVKEKFNLISKKVFFFYFGQKILFKSYRKFIIVLLFVDYIKFDHQSFFITIYFVLNPFLVLIIFIFIYFSLIIFLIENFYISYLIPIFLLLFIFI